MSLMIISVKILEKDVLRMDELVRNGQAISRSEVIRDAVKAYLKEEATA